MAVEEKAIGIIGGAGPYAGLDLLRKILAQTMASSDQEHLTVVSISRPSRIPDRTVYLLGDADLNPAYAIADQLLALEQMGAAVAGIPCNTAHARPIFEVVLQRLCEAGSQIRFLHMIEEVVRFLGHYHPRVGRVGVLATEGTYQTRLYPNCLEPAGIEAIIPDKKIQSAVHQAIYDSDFGIKANGFATDEAAKRLRDGGYALKQMGAEAVILGCTEISLVIRERKMHGTIVIDPTLILARALIREANPAKLLPLEM